MPQFVSLIQCLIITGFLGQPKTKRFLTALVHGIFAAEFNLRREGRLVSG